MPELPEPQPGLPYGCTDDDINALWAQDCPMCGGLGQVVTEWHESGPRNVGGATIIDEHGTTIVCPNCGGSGGVEIPF